MEFCLCIRTRRKIRENLLRASIRFCLRSASHGGISASAFSPFGTEYLNLALFARDGTGSTASASSCTYLKALASPRNTSPSSSLLSCNSSVTGEGYEAHNMLNTNYTAIWCWERIQEKETHILCWTNLLLRFHETAYVWQASIEAIAGSTSVQRSEDVGAG